MQLELKFDFSSFISKTNSSFVDLLLFLPQPGAIDREWISMKMSRNSLRLLEVGYSTKWIAVLMHFPWLVISMHSSPGP